MERPIIPSNKVRIVCLPLQSAPDHVNTWTYFVPSKKRTSTRVSWNDAGASGILLKPSVRTMKNSNYNSGRSSKRKHKMDSLTNEQYYYAGVGLLKNEQNCPPVMSLRSEQTFKLSRIQKPSSKTSVRRVKNVRLEERVHRNFDDPSGACNKDTYMSQLGLLPRCCPVPNNPSRQAAVRCRLLRHAAGSSRAVSAIGQSRYNHRVCAIAVEPNRKSGDENVSQEYVGQHERCKVTDSPEDVLNNHIEVDALNIHNSFSTRNTTDLVNLEKEMSIQDTVFEPRLPERVPELNSSLSDNSHQIEAKSEDSSSDELCIVSVRSLASAKEGFAILDAAVLQEPKLAMLKPIDEVNVCGRLLLKRSPLDPSKKFLYLDADYSLTKPVSSSKVVPALTDANMTTETPHYETSYLAESRRTHRSLNKPPRKRKTVKNRRSSTPVPSLPKSEPYKHSKPRKRPARRAMSDNPKPPEVAHEEKTPSRSVPTMITDKYLSTQDCKQYQRRSSAATEKVDSGLPKAGSRISQLREMLRKKEADLEEARKSLINFDYSMPE